MVTFEVTSDRECTINGIGLLRAGETIKLNKRQLMHFESEHGVTFSQAVMPNFIQVVAVVVSDQ